MEKKSNSEPKVKEPNLWTRDIDEYSKNCCYCFIYDRFLCTPLLHFTSSWLSIGFHSEHSSECSYHTLVWTGSDREHDVFKAQRWPQRVTLKMFNITLQTLFSLLKMSFTFIITCTFYLDLKCKNLVFLWSFIDNLGLWIIVFWAVLQSIHVVIKLKRIQKMTCSQSKSD